MGELTKEPSRQQQQRRRQHSSGPGVGRQAGAHLAARGAAGVVHHDARVLQRVPLALPRGTAGGGWVGEGRHRGGEQRPGGMLQQARRLPPIHKAAPHVSTPVKRTFLPTASRKPLMPMQPPKPTVPTSLLMCRIVSWMAREGTTCE